MGEFVLNPKSLRESKTPKIKIIRVYQCY